MMKRVENKIKKYINRKLEKMEDYAEYKYDEYFDETNKIENTDEITLINFELRSLEYKHEEKLFDIKFHIKHKEVVYIFETSNYYFYEGEFQWVEDIYENIDNLLRNFGFLLENYSYFIPEADHTLDEDESEGETIDEIAYDLGFEIDDDGHWNPVDTYYSEYDSFRDDLSYEDGIYTFNFSEDNGKFYWED